jgi:hypothetical protein
VFVSEALEILHRWEAAAASCSNTTVANSIVQHALQSGGSVLDEPWTGDEQSEKLAYVTEELCESPARSWDGLLFLFLSLRAAAAQIFTVNCSLSTTGESFSDPQTATTGAWCTSGRLILLVYEANMKAAEAIMTGRFLRAPRS